MGISAEYREFLTELFACIGPITFKRAFSGEAMMAGGAMVGYIINDRLHLRTDVETRPLYDAEGCEPFTFMKGRERIVTSYVSLPERLFDEPEELAVWARRAYEAAQQSPSAVARRKKRGVAPAVKKKKPTGASRKKG